MCCEMDYSLCTTMVWNVHVRAKYHLRLRIVKCCTGPDACSKFTQSPEATLGQVYRLSFDG